MSVCDVLDQYRSTLSLQNTLTQLFYALENNISGLLRTNVGPVAFLPELRSYKKLIDGLEQLMTIRTKDIEPESESSRTMKDDVEGLIALVNDLSV